jgi:hypothetical protein
MDVTESVGERDVGWLPVYRRGALCAVYVAIGFVALARGHSGVTALAAVGLMAAVLFWCSLDAAIHGKSFPHGLAIPLTATLPVSLAIYLVWTRGWVGLLSFVKAIALAVAAVLVASLEAWLLSFL